MTAASLVVMGLTGCVASQSDDEVEQRARTAGIVMSRGYDPIPARFAAARVTGERDPVSIDALQATGTTASGRIVLKISYRGQGFDATRSSVTRCFRYDFQHHPYDGQEPHPTDCGRREPIPLPDPATLPTVTEAVRSRVLTVLRSLSSRERLLPARVEAALRRALGTAYAFRVFTDRATGVTARVSAADTCVTAFTRPVSASATQFGLDCQS